MEAAEKKKISFITATFQAPEKLERAIACLMAQTDPHWEIIVSPDDGRNYGYLTKIDPRIRVVCTHEKQTGAGAARNRGLAIASGEYIAMLDDNDIVANNFVAAIIRPVSESRQLASTMEVRIAACSHGSNTSCRHARIRNRLSCGTT